MIPLPKILWEQLPPFLKPYYFPIPYQLMG